MHMTHTLTAVLTDVGDDAVAVGQPLRCGNLRNGGKDSGDSCAVVGRDLVSRGDVRFGNDQHMHRRLRVDIAEGVNKLVLVDLARGNLTGDNFAEQTVHKQTSLSFFFHFTINFI